ncbi:MAG: MYG1 family protein [Mesorhizobium sp.]|nr:MAG: hypothetical protein EOQ76_03690 [Mesorhizobium sp.]RWH40832.1 MAG: hypothetical protein EOQ79_02635 [Mesorhizobium sp.]TIM64445.1 MAG: MYG1 family protein [Mesorhizobium sp.]TIR61455.1 MAG: MYG1 family protein [Mesorhizobium sp.]TIR70651.1 MAG: MYG1 family protein [Mesorhizobium sp.]
MSRSSPFRQIDLSRALKAWLAAGLEVGRAEIDPSGKIIILPRGGVANRPTEPSNEWDDVLK